MAAEEYNWNARLCVLFKATDGAQLVVSPITNFNYTDDLPVDIIDSIDACNLGYSYGNPRYTFDFEVQAVNMAVFRNITKVAKKRSKFSIGLATMVGSLDDWVFDSIQLSDCMVTNITQGADNTNKIPTLKFSGVCLDNSISNNGLAITTNKTGGATGDL